MCVRKSPSNSAPVAERIVAMSLSDTIPGIGIDELEKRGELAFLKNGPVRRVCVCVWGGLFLLIAFCPTLALSLGDC